MPRPKRQPETPDAGPRISVIDRRLRNPFGAPSRDIPLTGEKRGWVVRTFSADAEHPNRHYDAVHRLGWQPVTPEDVAVPIEQLGYVRSADGRVVRGAGGHEVLMAMPQADFDRIQLAKAAANTRSLKPNTVRGEVAQATAQAHGDEAGEQAYKNFTAQEFHEPIGAVASE